MAPKSAKAKAAEKLYNVQMLNSKKYPMQNLAVINNGQCRICDFYVEINVPSDVDVLGQHYTTVHKISDLFSDQESSQRMVSQDKDSLAVKGTYTFSVFIKIRPW